MQNTQHCYFYELCLAGVVTAEHPTLLLLLTLSLAGVATAEHPTLLLL